MRRCVMLMLLIMMPLAPLRAQEDEGEAFVEITPQLQAAVRRGMQYLAREQGADGSFGSQRYGKHVGITALACLAFMSDGNLPNRGEYGDNVARGLDFVLQHVQET